MNGAKLRFSKHALAEIKRRNIPMATVEKVIDHPDQVVRGHGNSKVLQSRVTFGDGSIYLLRVVVGTDTEPNVVVTVYRTSKITKYWEGRS